MATKVLTKQQQQKRDEAEEQSEKYWADVSIKNLLLDGKSVDAQLKASVQDITLERTIEGASTVTITVYDPEKRVLKSGILQDRTTCKIGGKYFVYVACQKSGSTLTLTFEDREVSLLRRYTKPKKASRKKVTRAEFILSLVREVKNPRIKFFCPELHKTQSIEKASDKKDTKSKESDRDPGFGSGSSITVKGKTATRKQKEIISRVLDTGLSMKGVSEKLLIASIMTITQESNVSLLNDPSAGYGPFSQLRNGAWAASVTDVEADARSFFRVGIKKDKANPRLSLNDLCQAVQASGVPNGYGQWSKEATRTVKAYGGKAGGTKSRVRVKSYEFTRGKPGQKEDSWTCIQRLAQEVNWRAFMVGPTLYYMDELDLFASAPRMSISEDSKGVDTIDFEIDSGKKTSQIDIVCRTGLWEAPPGSTIRLRECGPADGKWLVSNISRSLFSNITSITCKRPSPPKPEPAPETVTVSGGSASVNSKGFVKPVGNIRSIAGKFGEQRATHLHAGLDIAVPVGTQVSAVSSGTIKFAGTAGGYGYMIDISHSDGLVSRYAHLSVIGAKVGDKVNAGDNIGKSGGAPGAVGAGSSQGPHLHFEIHKKGRPVCPTKYINGFPGGQCVRDSL